MALLTLTFALPALTFVIGPAIVSEVVPDVQRGTALLIVYSVMTVTGLLSPLVTGWIVQAAGSDILLGYSRALWLTSAVLIVGGVWGALYLNPEATRARLRQRAAEPVSAVNATL